MYFAYGALRGELEKTYEDRATVRQSKGSAIDPDTQESVISEATIFQNLPCRISFAEAESKDGTMTDEGHQKVKLFTGPNIEIFPGSRITVTRSNGVVLEFGFSAFPAVYPSHREYELTGWKGYY